MSDFGKDINVLGSDCISRQAAIDAIRASASKYTGFMEMEMYTDDDAVEAIEGLPSAQQWIPCKERLPEVGRNVLLSVGKGLYTAEGELKHDGTWVQYRWSANIENVDAWAEMPEPWRGEENETEN